MEIKTVNRISQIWHFWTIILNGFFKQSIFKQSILKQSTYFQRVYSQRFYFKRVYFQRVYCQRVYCQRVLFQRVYFQRVYFQRVYFWTIVFWRVALLTVTFEMVIIITFMSNNFLNIMKNFVFREPEVSSRTRSSSRTPGHWHFPEKKTGIGFNGDDLTKSGSIRFSTMTTIQDLMSNRFDLFHYVVQGGNDNFVEHPFIKIHKDHRIHQ